MIQNKAIVIGLTGGTGCGKSTVCSILKTYNTYIIDADKIAHSIIKKGNNAYFELINYFGKDILNSENEIDRKKLGKIVFSDKEKLFYLNNITHKYIIREIKDSINMAKDKQEYNYIVIDAPLLIETNLHKIVDEVWIVHCSLHTRLKRLVKRDNLSEEILIKRINSQTPFEQNKKYANFIIFNEDGANLEEIIKQRLKRKV
ncbi:dephospho-CoA kinase [uncultured Tyzzerella sp.]|uniref:dephospho-CoA kinase n=1 Tax=uncultured Tyzzerella sp. TaxID=2321398 RepID=UPI002942126A|nr:dephospho-CoA kinase [uncultured Tyzzerella sp.]